MVLREKYSNYENSLMNLNLEALSQRRQSLSLKFAKSGMKYDKLNDLLPLNEKVHGMKTRECEKYKTNHANTERLKTGSVITMQKYLNEEHRQNTKRNCG